MERTDKTAANYQSNADQQKSWLFRFLQPWSLSISFSYRANYTNRHLSFAVISSCTNSMFCAENQPSSKDASHSGLDIAKYRLHQPTR